MLSNSPDERLDEIERKIHKVVEKPTITKRILDNFYSKALSESLAERDDDIKKPGVPSNAPVKVYQVLILYLFY
jgi:hypothetical protein